jgi:hypothetical protein
MTALTKTRAVTRRVWLMTLFLLDFNTEQVVELVDLKELVLAGRLLGRHFGGPLDGAGLKRDGAK